MKIRDYVVVWASSEVRNLEDVDYIEPALDNNKQYIKNE